MKRLANLASIAGFILALWPEGAAQAQTPVHDDVQSGLVYLFASATPASGPNIGVTGGVESQGSGFFVSNDGYILTTAHFFKPLEDVGAKNIVIVAAVGGSTSRKIPVQFVSVLQNLDLALLKASIPFDMDAPTPLKTGDTAGIDRGDPPGFLTSGFHGTNYTKKRLSLITVGDSNVPYAWVLDGKTNSGQSGSPVYLKDGTVVGLIKATARDDDERTLMIPIEYAMPLIGHIKLQELNSRIEWLEKIIGEIADDAAPLNSRLSDVEGNIEEIASRFTWSAESASDGSIRVKYEKLISGGLQVDEILLNLTPNMRVYQDPDTRTIIVTDRTRILKLRDDGSRNFDRATPFEDRAGEFIIPEVKMRLVNRIENFADAVGGKQPYRDLELSVVPVIKGEKLPPQKIIVVPDYVWN